jgi:putative ABC transport system permease protein
VQRSLASALPLALNAIAQYPLRAGLTAFGILIGVAAVVLTLALGDAAERAVIAQVSALGDNSLTIQPERIERTGPAGEMIEARLTEADGDALARESTNIARVAAVIGAGASASFGGFRTNVEVVGTERTYLTIRGWSIAQGNSWNDAAEKTGARVCLIGQTVVNELFDGADPVGRVIRLGPHPFVVVGQLAAKGADANGQDLDDVVIAPIGAVRSRLRRGIRLGQVDQLLLSATSAATVVDAQAEATTILRQRHGLSETANNDFRVRGQDAFSETRDRIVRVLSLLLTAVAGVSLIVGGIGIMNILLVSVAERTRDVGLRMAIGATRADVLLQFLIEAVVLSLLGGTLGVVLALILAQLLRRTLNLPLEPSVSAMALAIGVSGAIGVVFGLLPARRAALLDPIEALRRE